VLFYVGPHSFSTSVTQIVETLAHIVLGSPHLRTLVDPDSPPEPPTPPPAILAPPNGLTLLDLWTAGPGAGGGASLRRGVLRDPITLTPASTRALAFLAEDRTHLSLSCAGRVYSIYIFVSSAPGHSPSKFTTT
jgi:hypothetical protein